MCPVLPGGEVVLGIRRDPSPMSISVEWSSFADLGHSPGHDHVRGLWGHREVVAERRPRHLQVEAR